MEEVILPLEILSNDFGRSLNFLIHKRSFSAYSLNLQKRSLRKLFKSDPHEGYLGRLKDGKSSDAIVGEQNHLEDNPIFSPSMPTLDDFNKPTIESILDPNESYSALSPKPPNNLRNPPTHLTHRNHLDRQDDREEQHQWLKRIKNQYAIAIECVDKALYETNSKGNPRGFLDTYVESPLEEENNGDFNKQEIYFINIPSVSCSYETSPYSLSLSSITPHEIFNPSCSLFLKSSKGWF